MAVLNVKYWGRSRRRSSTIATPIATTSRPPISETVLP
jgi:hypothetical protein